MHTKAKAVTSRLLNRFCPTLFRGFVGGRLGEDLGARMLSLPDEGAELPVTVSWSPYQRISSPQSTAFCFFDPASRVLFTGDVRGTMVKQCLDWFETLQYGTDLPDV